MPGMPDLILKAPVLKRLEILSRIPGMKNSQKLKDAIARLNGPLTDPDNRLVKIARDLGLYASDAEADHFKAHWLDDPAGSGFWPGIDTESILRKGLWLACTKFKNSGRPCEYFWVISGDQNSTRWEISVSKGKHQITIMLHTPQFPCFVPTVHATNMWIVREEAGAVISRKVLIPQP
ncbi:MAG: hypothetical protein ACRERC_00010 [Candidatus Binatia bacterium]